MHLHYKIYFIYIFRNQFWNYHLVFLFSIIEIYKRIIGILCGNCSGSSFKMYISLQDLYDSQKLQHKTRATNPPLLSATVRIRNQRHFIKARWIISDKKNKRLEKSMPLATLAHCAFNLKRVS